MDQDFAPRWNQESEETIDSPELPAKRSRFQQELVNLFRPRTEVRKVVPEDEPGREESSDISKKKTPRGWRSLFANIVKKDAPKKVAEMKSELTLPNETLHIQHGTESWSEPTESAPRQDRDWGQKSEAYEAEQISELAQSAVREPEHISSIIAAQKPALEQATVAVRVAENAPEQTIYQSKNTNVVQIEQKASSKNFVSKTSEYWRRRLNRQARGDVKKLNKETKNDRQILSEQNSKHKAEHSKLREVASQLKAQVEALEARQRIDRERLKEAAEKRAETTAHEPSVERIIYEKPPAVPPPLYVEAEPNISGEIEYKKPESITLVEKYSTPEEKREQPENHQKTTSGKKEVQKVEAMPEKYFDRRHEVMDESKEDKKQRKHTKSLIKTKSPNGSSQGFQSVEEQLRSGQPALKQEKKTEESSSESQSEKGMYRQSVEYGVGGALFIIVLGLLSYILR